MGIYGGRNSTLLEVSLCHLWEDIQKMEQRSTGGESVSPAGGCTEDRTTLYWR